MMTARYTDAKIEQHIKSAIEESTPDILDELISEIEAGTSAGADEGRIEPAASPVRKRRGWVKAIAGCAAALMLFAGALTIFNSSKDQAVAVVDLDVNPSVELSIDKEHKIIEAKALNEDGKTILGDMELEGTDVKVGCNALIGSMLQNGYISDSSNSVLVSVSSDDQEKGREIEHMISGSLNESFSSSHVSGSVFGQYVDKSAELESFASDNDISLGKAGLIKKLMATKSRHMTEEALLKLSTQELILLGQERNVEADDSYGKADTSSYISKDEALSIAVRESGLSDVPASAASIEFDCDDGIITYEVEFEAGGREYEFDINAQTGEIITHDADVIDADDRDGDEIDDDRDDIDDDRDGDRDDADDDRDDDDHDNDHDDDGHDDGHDDHDDDD